MKQETISIGSGRCVTITYPSEIAYKGDEVYFEILNNQNTTLLVEYQLTNLTTSKSSTVYDYKSPFKRVVVPLGEVASELWEDNNQSYKLRADCWEIDEYNRETPFTVEFTFNLLYGRSLKDRTHGTRYVYLVDGESFAYLNSPVNGTLKLGGVTIANVTKGLNLVNFGSLTGEKSVLTLETPNNTPSADIISINASVDGFLVQWSYEEADEIPYAYSGGLWSEDTQAMGDYTIVVEKVDSCNTPNTLVFRWYDLDGVERKMVGRLTQATYKSKSNDLTRHNYEYNGVPSWVGTSYEEEISVGFVDTDRLFYFGDILYSEVVQMKTLNGEWASVKPTSSSLKTTENQTEDYTVTFKTFE